MKKLAIWILLIEAVRGTLMFPNLKVANNCMKEISKLKMYGATCTRNAKYLQEGRVLNVIGEGETFFHVVLDAETIGYVMVKDFKDITNWE